MNNNIIAAQLWKSGLFNQLFSLEIIVGLGALLNKKILFYDLCLYNMYCPNYEKNERYINLKDGNKTKRITELLDWDNEGWIIKDENLSKTLPEFKTTSILKRFVNCDKSDLVEQENRKKIINLDPETRYNFIGTFGLYSEFFLNRTSKIDLALSKIKWKEPYLELANEISTELGNYSGVHLRDSDMKSFLSVSDENFTNGLDKMLDFGLPVILSSDSPEREIIQKHKKKYQIIDDIIRYDWGSRFKQLPNRDEVTFGLICNLVLCNSKNFIGTPGSTFSMYIQREVYSRTGIPCWDMFDCEYTTSTSTGMFLTKENEKSKLIF